MKSTLNRFSSVWILSLFITWVVASCTKITTTELGSDLIPPVDNITTFDTTLDVVAYNQLFVDSTYPRIGFTSTGNLPDHPLGAVVNDPQFGTLTSMLVVELKPSIYPFSFGTTPDSLSLDSVVLCLGYRSIWGDTNAVQKLQVFPMEDKLDPDSAYRINEDFTFAGDMLLGEKVFAPRILDDSLFPRNERLKNQLRIRLNDEFGQLLLSKDTNNAYKSDSAFVSFFRGFAIRPESTGDAAQASALMYFNLLDEKTYLKVYYKRLKADGNRDTLNRNFTFNPFRGGQGVKVSRDISGSQLDAHLANPNPGGDTILYLGSTPGTYAQIETPSFAGFKALKGNVVIHKAELSMQQVRSTGERDEWLTPPTNLFLDVVDTGVGKFRPVPYDFTYIQGNPNIESFGGTVKVVGNNAANAISEYRFELTRYMQSYITRNELLYKLRLYSPFVVFYPNSFINFGVNNLGKGRVKVGGGNLQNGYRMRVRVIYSIL